jgi:ferredoxin-NADP reductase
MAKRIHRLSLIIAEVEDIAPSVRAFTLTDPERWPLPPFTPGAHIDLHLPTGRVRQYSLCNDPQEGDRYVVTVQSEPEGRGGSAEMFELGVGSALLASLPRNTFPLAEAAGRHVMVAGGIGITPFLSMVSELRRSDAKWELHICSRERGRVADGGRLADAGQESVVMHVSSEDCRLDIAELINSLDQSDHLYVCGPERMITAALEFGEGLGDRLHIERFGTTIAGVDPAYEIELASSGRRIAVAAGQGMLDALRAAGVEVPSSCEGGVCLECKTRYLEGSPVHRDLLMSAEDRRSFLTPCVSGCSSDRIVLDL